VSAEILRRAAALMRSRAEGATPGPWSYSDEAVWAAPGFGQICGMGLAGNGVHIASWHPAVALAVADWLEAEAAALQAMAAFSGVAATVEHEVNIRGAALTIRKHDKGRVSLEADTSVPALAVARAYLGETP